MIQPAKTIQAVIQRVIQMIQPSDTKFVSLVSLCVSLVTSCVTPNVTNDTAVVSLPVTSVSHVAMSDTIHLPDVTTVLQDTVKCPPNQSDTVLHYVTKVVSLPQKPVVINRVIHDTVTQTVSLPVTSVTSDTRRVTSDTASDTASDTKCNRRCNKACNKWRGFVTGFVSGVATVVSLLLGLFFFLKKNRHE